jgi:hypothetical protein
MREIDSNSEARLSRALRSLTASSPAEAPREIGEALTVVFRRHHARRRMIRRTAMAAAILCLVLPATVLLVVTGRPRKSIPTADAVVASPVATIPAQPVVVAASLPARVKKSHATPGRNSVVATGSDVATIDGFMDLPSSDQAVRGEDLRLVRLEVTGRALQMVGAPVAEESADNRMLADFIVGQDGTPYAVRLVR